MCGGTAGAASQIDIDVQRAQRVVFFLSIFFLSLSSQREKKLESSPKKRKKPIQEEMRVGRGREVIGGRVGGRIGLMKGRGRGGGRSRCSQCETKPSRNPISKQTSSGWKEE